MKFLYKKNTSSIQQKSALVELPEIWRKTAIDYTSQNTRFNADKTFDFSLTNHISDLLVPNTTGLAPSIVEAILGCTERKMALHDIEDWLSANNKRTKAKDILQCLSSCSFFVRMVLNGTIYWRIDSDRLKTLSFAQNIIDTGVVGGFENWNGTSQPRITLE